MKSAERKAIDKARAWFRDSSLITNPEEMPYTPPESVVLVGEIVAIEYASDKFDGTMRVYRHDVTGHRNLMISPDGGTLIVHPPFKITTRGIEG